MSLPFLHRLVRLCPSGTERSTDWWSTVLSRRREASMKHKILSAGLMAIALSTAASLSPAAAQEEKGTLYAFHSRPVVGGCPGLDWHVTVSPDNKLTGFVAWDAGK